MGTVKLEPLGQRLLLTGGRCCTVTWVQSAILEDERPLGPKDALSPAGSASCALSP